MSAIILDGSATARKIREELAARTAELYSSTGVVPRLDVVLVGDDPASVTYVGMKKRAAEAAGMRSETHRLSADATQEQVLELVRSLNADPGVHGILVQHPLPRQLDEQAILDEVSPEKDVDGISSLSLGRLLTGLPSFRPCTPLGIIRLLDDYGVEIQGRRAVVVGRSIILGKPAALLLLERHATVTVCHSRTQDLPAICREADILVAAVGKVEMIRGDWIRPGACVIDAGYNRVPGRDRDVGDVHYEEASAVAGWITPVPGGVGPMTIAMLLQNTLEAARLQAGA
ncbi:MAG: bifunctional methylenetetrahydrofolate dehydrogenase/methenyltetrahydrofolate cyclohydrolase FolD [Armatimonadota bacterium]